MKKLPTGAVMVLPASDMVLGILERMEQFAAQPGRDLFRDMLNHKPIPKSGLLGINRVSVAELVKALYLDLLHESSKWAQFSGHVSYTDRQWKRMVHKWDENVDKKLETALFSEVIQEAYEDIHDWVLELDGAEPTWHVWYVRRMGLDIIVEKGPDYRVLDWERRMNAGAEYVKAEEAGEQMPAEAWKPDAEARRYAELLALQQSEESLLGQTSMGELDHQRRKTREGTRARRRSARIYGTL